MIRDAGTLVLGYFVVSIIAGILWAIVRTAWKRWFDA